jgi:hypothetical protein
MYLKISNIMLVDSTYGKDIVITRVGLYSDDDKWIKWVKLNEYTKQLLIEHKIPLQIKPDNER